MYITSIFIPLASSLCTGILGRKIGVTGSNVVSVVYIFISIVIIIVISYEVVFSQSTVNVELWNWIESDTLSVNWSFHFDPITVVILIVVSQISFVVHVYSTWYIGEDPHVQRFISYLSAFTFFIMILVSGDSYLLIFVGWEGIGVLSYLLINFWYTRIQASKAAIQAITVNRVGDIFISIGFIACLWTFSGIDYGTAFSLSPYISTASITFIGIMFIIGAISKSAQLGLHTWLVSAMEGPTPVSSILHAATLVTAGIYLLIRSSPILEYAPDSLLCIIFVGQITTIFAASSGLFQNDMKRLIAYSTISQIGYLVIAVGISQYSAALIHIASHAYFKALLFLSAGGVLHSISDEQDIRKLGGIMTLLPFTYTAIIVGSISLIAIFPLSGYYSKDIILELAYSQYTYTGYQGYVIGTLTAFMTAFYSIRLVCITFTGRPNASRQQYTQTHDQPILVQVTFTLLAFISIFFGYISRDIMTGIGTDGLISSMCHRPESVTLIEAEFIPITMKLIPTIITIFSAIIAFYLYTYAPEHIVYISRVRVIIIFFNKKWMVDVVYSYIILISIRLGYVCSQMLDKGSLEIIGPTKIESTMNKWASSMSRIDTGVTTSYATYMLFATLSLSIITLF
uniref:NADH-ubiquinone oxidoreductase chain 5 n=1 Tax=Phakopsora meibomiae TaxID=169999 RepID=D8V195_9BASI|nr:NADH dehydrogenase subunit 5 [Phakopsora meibomiae]ACT36180.1 NADH dehydrogenase subunit 5 [Phakopsora meibomiae]